MFLSAAAPVFTVKPLTARTLCILIPGGVGAGVVMSFSGHRQKYLARILARKS